MRRDQALKSLGMVLAFSCLIGGSTLVLSQRVFKSKLAVTFVVNSLEDSSDDTDSQCTLREVLEIINSGYRGPAPILFPGEPAFASELGDCFYTYTRSTSGTPIIDLSHLTGTLELRSALPPITTDLSLIGPGPADLTLARVDNTKGFRILTITGKGTGVHVIGLTLANGHDTQDPQAEFQGGGGIYLDAGSQLRLEASSLYHNRSYYNGGGIQNNGGDLIVVDSTFEHNSARMGGGGIASDGKAIIIGSEFSYNTVEDWSGGAISTYGEMEILNSNLTENRASYGGGIRNGKFLKITNLEVRESLFQGNHADRGGGIRTDNDRLQLHGNKFHHNSAEFGDPDINQHLTQ